MCMQPKQRVILIHRDTVEGGQMAASQRRHRVRDHCRPEEMNFFADHTITQKGQTQRTTDSCWLPSVDKLLHRRKHWPDGTGKYLDLVCGRECVQGRISGPATGGAEESSGRSEEFRQFCVCKSISIEKSVAFQVLSKWLPYFSVFLGQKITCLFYVHTEYLNYLPFSVHIQMAHFLVQDESMPCFLLK